MENNSQKYQMPPGLTSVKSAVSAYPPSAVVPIGTHHEQYDPWLEINTKNLSWNVSKVRGIVGDKPIMAVVKCNAYGHGSVGVAQVLEKQGIQRFAGDTISYHRRRKVEEEKLLAILPLGYADGYPFQAVNKAKVLIRGRRWPLIVYMSANHATVDITGSKDIQVGDKVVLFGTQEGQTISIVEVAAWSDSSVYKVATGMSPFLPRIFLE